MFSRFFRKKQRQVLFSVMCTEPAANSFFYSRNLLIESNTAVTNTIILECVAIKSRIFAPIKNNPYQCSFTSFQMGDGM